MTVPRVSLAQLEHPIVQAPMAGGPSTPALTVAVSDAGGLGMVAAGYRTPAALAEDIAAVRGATTRSFGVNLFAPPAPRSTGDGAAVRRYAERLAAEAARQETAVGTPRHDDDGWEEKLAIVAAERVAVVSFAFGCPSQDVVAALRAAGAAVWVTVTTPAEGATAAEAGVDALVVQGVEAGGHRASFDLHRPGDLGLLALLQLVGAAVPLPLVASGGIATGRGLAAVLAAGAEAAQLGTAFMSTPEAATSPPQREALRGDAPTALTRAFSGRAARGIVNRFMREHEPAAPAAYPDVHHLTAPLRAAARARGDADAINLWAGQAYPLTREEPAGDMVRRLAAEARAALREAAARADAAGRLGPRLAPREDATAARAPQAAARLVPDAPARAEPPET
jgi:nitronate monooxygenase